MNPANGPSRRPDYKAQGEPSLVQKDLLASKLVGFDSETARLNSIAQGELRPEKDSLCNTVKCQLCIAARPEPALAKARPETIISLPEAERATREVNARRSPLVDSRG